MKKLYVVLAITGGLLALSLTGHFMTVRAAADSSPSCQPLTPGNFPYQFMPNSGFAQGRTSLSATVPAGSTPTSNGWNLPAGNQTVTIHPDYFPCGPATSPNGQIANILQWITIDANVGPGKVIGSVSSVQPQTAGGQVIGCPGTTNPGTGLAAQQIIYNDQNLQQNNSGSNYAPDGIRGTNGPSQSPVAYNRNTGGGIENCLSEGLSVFWEQSGANQSNPGNSFTINTQGVYSTFCLTENVSVEFPGDAGLFFSTTTQGKDPQPGMTGAPNSSASHLAEQSNGLCFHTSAPGSGCPDPNGCPKGNGGGVISQTANCTTASATDGGNSPNVMLTDQAGNNNTAFADNDPSRDNYSTTGIRYDNGRAVQNSSSWYTQPWASGGNGYMYVPTRTIVVIKDSAGNVLAFQILGNTAWGRNYAGYTGENWSYQPKGETVSYTFYHQELLRTQLKIHNSPDYGYYWVTYSTAGTGNRGPCYSATCTVTAGSNIGGSNGQVEANSQYPISATVTNTGGVDGNTTLPDNLGGYGFSLTGGSPYKANGIPGIGPGQTEYFTVYSTAPPSGTSTVTYYPDYNGDPHMVPEGFGSSCSTNIDTFQRFDINPNAGINGNAENPTTITYTAQGSNTGATVNAATSTWLTYQPYGGSTNTVDGPWNTNDTYGTVNYSHTYNTPPNQISAGNQFCSNMTVNPAHGWIDSSSNEVGTSSDKAQPSCLKVVNRPFPKTFNSGVLSGGVFTGATCAANSGVLASWNNNSGAQPDFGASGQLSNVATGDITGFASNQSSFNNDPLGLSFANTVHNSGSGTNGSGYSPNLGGDLGGCLNLTTSTPVAGATTLPAGSDATSAGPLTIPTAHNVTYYVPGDVYISNNITYQHANDGTWTPTGDISKPTDVPSFNLIAAGDIFIGPGVTELDGVYTALGNGGTSKGEIYTCAPGISHPLPQPFIDGSYGTCNKQLVVYGSFVDNKTVMLRTFGSLRDETPIPVAPAFYSGTINGASGNCTPLASSPCQAGSQPGSVFSYQEYRAKYNVSAPVTANNKFLSLNYQNFINTPPNNGWPPPAGDYKFDVEVDDSNGYVTDLFLTPGSPAPPVNLGKQAISSITFTWRLGNNYWIDPGTPTCPSLGCDPNLQINSFDISASGGLASPPSPLACSNNGGQLLGTTCAAEVFILSPELYLSDPKTGKVGGGSAVYDSITSLPPVL